MQNSEWVFLYHNMVVPLNQAVAAAAAAHGWHAVAGIGSDFRTHGYCAPSTRFGLGPGREYALTYEAADHLGNVGRCTAIVTVPHDQRRGSR